MVLHYASHLVHPPASNLRWDRDTAEMKAEIRSEIKAQVGAEISAEIRAEIGPEIGTDNSAEI